MWSWLTDSGMLNPFSPTESVVKAKKPEKFAGPNGKAPTVLVV
jgi:hypothetical protein